MLTVSLNRRQGQRQRPAIGTGLPWLALCPLMLVVGAAQAEWKRDYTRAKSAWDEKQYAESIQLLQGVLLENPTPSRSERLTSRGIAPYLPQLYLGLSLVELNDCPGALKQLNNPELVAVLRNLSSESALRERALQRCPAAQVAAAPAEKPAPPVVAPPPAASPPVATTPVAATTEPPNLPDATADPAPQVTAPVQPPPVVDPWVAERPRVKQLIDQYLAGRLAVASIPQPAGFASRKSQQWIYLLRSLLAARNAASAPPGATTQAALGQARAEFANARRLGDLPNWRELASPRMQSLMSGG